MVAFSLIIYLLSVTINLVFWFLWFRISPKNSAISTNGYKSESVPVSIIICSKNAIQSLQNNLPSILDQNYPNFEVIVVDDDSSDGSLNWLKHLSHQHDHLVILSCQNTLPGKKQALKIGIDHAKSEWILLTDADCKASSTRWIKEMMNARMESTKIVLGYSPYRRSFGFLNKFIRYETTMTALQYLSASVHGVPYMGVGRNILYHQSMFNTYDTVIQYNSPSGDDDILVNAMATTDNLTTCISKNAIILSEPEQTWNSFILQKTRHVSTSYSYKLSHKILLLLFASSQVGILLIFALCLSKYWLVAIFVFAVRFLFILFRSKMFFERLNVSDLRYTLAILDIGLSLYYLLIHPLGFMLDWGKRGKFVRS